MSRIRLLKLQSGEEVENEAESLLTCERLVLGSGWLSKLQSRRNLGIEGVHDAWGSNTSCLKSRQGALRCSRVAQIAGA